MPSLGNMQNFAVNMQLVFCSYSAGDEDYEGYDYSLHGQLSEVRIVYLNRFLQEVLQFLVLHCRFLCHECVQHTDINCNITCRLSVTSWVLFLAIQRMLSE